MPGFLALVPAWAWRWFAIAAIAAVFGGWCWFKGNEHGTQKLIDYQAAQAVETVRIAAERIKVVTVTETKWRTRIKEVTAQGEKTEREAKTHVTPADDAGCTVPAGFVSVFNAAWSGAAAGSAAESDRRPSGVPLSTVAETDAFNAASCLIYKTQRDGLIEFYRKQQGVK